MAVVLSPVRMASTRELFRSRVLRTFAETGSLRETAARCGISPAEARRALIQTGLVVPEHIQLQYRPTTRPWDELSLRVLREMLGEGWHPHALAIFFNRPVLDVELAITWLGLPVPALEGEVGQ